MRKIYAIGVGGSGAKCLEAAIFLQALGIYGDCELRILLVDADNANGNSQRTDKNFRTTEDAQKIFEQGKTSFMRGAFHNYGIWNPLADQIHSGNLASVFNQEALQAGARPLAKLFNALYSPAEQQADLNVGFRGRPPIGSAVVSRLELDEPDKKTQPSSGSADMNRLESDEQDKTQQSLGEAWQQLFDDLVTDLQGGNKNEVVVHFFGSIFGGTGASGVPTLARLISNRLKKDKLKVRIHGSLLLPYFGFNKPNDGVQTVFAETRFFALNTKAALQYLTEQSEGCFNSVYLLGDHEKTDYPSSTGGVSQENGAHFVELYAALAADHGFSQPLDKTRALYISRANGDRILWTDLPNNKEVKRNLSKGVRFAYAWLYNFSMELDEAIRISSPRFAKGAPWFRHYFSLKGGNDEKPLVSAENQKEMNSQLTKWSWCFLRWAIQLANSSRGEEQFFKFGDQLREEFKDADKDKNGKLQNFDPEKARSYHERLHALVIDTEISVEAQQNDRLDTIKNHLADQGEMGQFGVFGLAHALFDLV